MCGIESPARPMVIRWSEGHRGGGSLKHRGKRVPRFDLKPHRCPLAIRLRVEGIIDRARLEGRGWISNERYLDVEWHISTVSRCELRTSSNASASEVSLRQPLRGLKVLISGLAALGFPADGRFRGRSAS